MATIDSNLIGLRNRHRGLYSGQEYDVAARMPFPTGTVFTAGDILRAVPIGENQVVTKVKAYAVGATGALAVSLGYFQMLDEAGQPVVVERNGPFVTTGAFGTPSKFTSPVSDPDAYAPAAVLSTARQVVVTPTTKLAGPVYFGAIVTTGATLANAAEIFLGATIDGEDSIHFIDGPRDWENQYLLD